MADDDVGEDGESDEESGQGLDDLTTEEITGGDTNRAGFGVRVHEKEEAIRMIPTMEDGCKLSMRIERLQKMANGDFSTMDVRHRPDLGAKPIHGKHGSISFNMPEFLKLFFWEM
ncbi:UNVERIFIED_CONTAM: hypothetical protein Sindi_0724900 [Sesamum indicum]